MNAGCDPQSGFDCSGLALHILVKTRIPIPEGMRHCNELFDLFGVLIHFGLQKRGDLVFFSRNGTAPSHVGIMISSNEFVHAPGKDGTKVEITSLKRAPIPISTASQIYLENPIGFKRPAVRAGRWQKFQRGIK